MTSHHHANDYIELPVAALAEAKRVDGAAFGWTFQDYGPDYAGIHGPEGGVVGGLRKDADVARGGPLVVLYSTDLEASVAAVASPTSRMPSANRNRARVVSRLFAMAATRLAADFLPMRSKAASCSSRSE